MCATLKPKTDKFCFALMALFDLDSSMGNTSGHTNSIVHKPLRFVISPTYAESYP
jgi:hypothetical protein